MPITLNGTNGLVFNDASTQNTAATGFGFKNRIINGDMRIDQRNAGASVTVTTSNQFTIDRWLVNADANSKFSAQRSTVAPAGFTNSILLTSLSAYTPTGNESFNLQQRFEGFNCADLGWGTANAQPVTLSFWVRSSLTGTFGGALPNYAYNRAYPFTYSISSANTWEYKTITIAGDTTGTWSTDNGGWGTIVFSAGAAGTSLGTAGAWTGSGKVGATGQTNLVATNGATLYITGVQLEKGSTATSFDYRPYGTELALCQRYAQVYTGGNNTRFALGGNTESTLGFPTLFLPVVMRASPSISVSAASDFKLVNQTGTAWTATGIALDGSTTSNVTINVNVGTTTSGSVLLAGANSNAKLTLSSEL